MCICGPSAAGKTTFAAHLAEQLRARIEEQRALQATLTAQGEDALREIGEAEEQQRLRRQEIRFWGIGARA